MYSASGSLLNTPPTVGAVCVWVAEMSMFAAGMPVFLAASAFASSSSSRGIMQLSTTTMASLVVPSSRTRQRAWSGSCAEVALRSANPPFTEMGNFSGVTSIAYAPARRFGSALAPALEIASARSKATSARINDPRKCLVSPQ